MRGARLLSSKAADADSPFPVVPVVAVLLSAPIVGFKTGVLSLEQLPDNVRAALPPWATRYLLTATPPPPSEAPPAVLVPPALSPERPAELPAVAAPAAVSRYLAANKPQIVALLWRDLEKVKADGTWSKVFFQPFTARKLARERREIEQQLARFGEGGK
ncbi:hypothetical protein KFE25_009669 [Diacronema lutheri]|uniref:Uncharacterized protein n=1 Tax=Diacronema lutheri TaxID=2081491 RepID=A0A8J6CKM1_DIALT|nr:hypothetical protein KFE25_009669 [Diacronema lutheri]